MRLLITNDDGINSSQIHGLASYLSEKGHEAIVVAPEKEMSAVSSALTMHNPLRIRNKTASYTYQCYSVEGTPVDCVKLALEVIMENPPDMIISGVNRGLNIGSDIFYSGTVSAAMEGYLHGISSIAISAPENFESDFHSLLEYFYESIFIPVVESGHKGLYNLNFPKSEPFDYLRITELGSLKYINVYKERKDPRGNTYYWLAGEISDNANNSCSDVHAIKNGHVSLTPLQCDLTDRDAISQLKTILK